MILGNEGFVQHRQQYKLVPVRPSEYAESNLARLVLPDLREDVKYKGKPSAQRSNHLNFGLIKDPDPNKLTKVKTRKLRKTEEMRLDSTLEFIFICEFLSF